MIQRLIDLLTYNPKEPLIFSSGLFLFLFLGFSFFYMLLRHKLQPRLFFVTLFSYYFYYKSSGFYFFLLAVVTLTDFLIARDRKSTRLNSSHANISYAVFCLKKKKKYNVIV